VDDFSSAQLLDPSTVEVDNAAGCSLLGEYAVQAVTLPGVSVDRGVTGPMDAGVTDLDVTGLAPVPADRAILLHTHRYGGVPTGPICAKVVRGEADDAGTALHFSRGVTGGQIACGGPGEDIQAISWERIRVAPGDRLQRLVVDLPSTAAQVVVPVAAVDPTRTLVLASGQGSAGQAYGETRDSSSMDARPAALMLALEDAGTSVRATRSVGIGSSRWSVYVWELGPVP